MFHIELVKQRILPEEGVASGVASNLEPSEGLGAVQVKFKC